MEVPCIKCGDTGCVRINLEDDELHCTSCDEAFTVEDVQKVVSAWSRMIPWLEAHPARQQSPSLTQ